MLMNILASAILFLFIGPFNHVRTRETGTTGSALLQVNSPQQVFLAVNGVLELNCSFSEPTHDLHPTLLLWKHNNTWLPNSSYVVNNNTVQLRISHVGYEDAGVYGCGVPHNSSQFQNVSTPNITVVVGEKPRLKQVAVVNVFGKPVQELTLQWVALDVNLTYKLFIGRSPYTEHYSLCQFHNSAFCTRIPKNKHEVLSCHVEKKVLGHLFHWQELTVSEPCGSNYPNRCDTFCAKVVVENAFGASESVSWSNLKMKAQCPPLQNVNVSMNEQRMTVSWKHPLLVWKNFSVHYYLSYNVTQVLTGTMLSSVNPFSVSEESHTIDGLEPYSRYQFAITCSLTSLSMDKRGPSVYVEETSREKAPSTAPSCEVYNRSIDGSAFVMVKPPPKSTWNGIPRRYKLHLLYNGEQQKVVNASLDGLDVGTPMGVWLNDLDLHMNYSVRVTMCTDGGCGENFSQPCFIDEVTIDKDSSKKGSALLQVNSPEQVFIAVNGDLELNCSFSVPTHDLHPTLLLWKHNNTWLPNCSYVVNNNTVQLRISHVRYEDAGVYGCGVPHNSSQFQNVSTPNITVVVGEKPRLKRVTVVNVFGKPVQELTLQWVAVDANLTYKLFIGRIPYTKHYSFCQFHNSAFCTRIPKNKHEVLSCHVEKKVLGHLFNWHELTVSEPCSSDYPNRCDTFCAKVVVENAFGASESAPWWNLQHQARCPPPHNLNVSMSEHSMTVSWKHPPLVWKNFSVYYYLSYNVTQVLTGMMLSAVRDLRVSEESHTIDGLEPYSRYQFALNCSLSARSTDERGPSVYLEETSREEAPSTAPSCEVYNRSIDGSAFVMLKPPPKSTWNGIPRRYKLHLLYNGEQQKVVNASLDGLNVGTPMGAWLNDLDLHMKYSVRVTMCTNGGCGENFSKPCFIDEVTIAKGSNKKVAAGTGKAAKAAWLAMAFGLAVGVILCGFFTYLIIRQRSRKKKRPPLCVIFTELGSQDTHNYENDPDDGPSLCEESQHYDTVPSTPLLKDVDCSVGNCRVTKV